MFEVLIFALFVLFALAGFIAFLAVSDGELGIAGFCVIVAWGFFNLGSHTADRLEAYKALESDNIKLAQVVQQKNMALTNLRTINSTMEEAINEQQGNIHDLQVNLYDSQTLATEKSNALDKAAYELRMQETKYAQCDATVSALNVELDKTQQVSDAYREAANIQTNKLKSIQALLEK